MIDVDHPEFVGSTAQADVRMDLSVKAEAGAGADNTSMAELAVRSLARKYTAEAVLTVPTPVPPGVLVPRGMAVARTSMNPWGQILLAESPHTAILVRAHPRTTTVEMYAADVTHLASLWRSVSELARGCLKGKAAETPVDLWSYVNGARCTGDHVVAEPWAQVRRNYPGSTAHALDAVMGMTGPPSSGRLLLWYGPPGTGKTSAVTSLMSEWVPWCDAHLISDPEQLFGSPDYLMTVLQNRARPAFDEALPSMDQPRAMRWKLIVCEDADEYLRSDARQRSGPALGRLLNATDGILGRNSQALILLTTNDDISRLHPALTRPGRCLSSVHFPPMSRSEAAMWCPPNLTPPTGEATLAELFARAAGTATSDTEPTVGMYL